jgi:hypothetical protein
VEPVSSALAHASGPFNLQYAANLRTVRIKLQCSHQPNDVINAALHNMHQDLASALQELNIDLCSLPNGFAACPTASL